MPTPEQVARVKELLADKSLSPEMRAELQKELYSHKEPEAPKPSPKALFDAALEKPKKLDDIGADTGETLPPEPPSGWEALGRGVLEGGDMGAHGGWMPLGGGLGELLAARTAGGKDWGPRGGSQAGRDLARLEGNVAPGATAGEDSGPLRDTSAGRNLVAKRRREKGLAPVPTDDGLTGFDAFAKGFSETKDEQLEALRAAKAAHPGLFYGGMSLPALLTLRGLPLTGGGMVNAGVNAAVRSIPDVAAATAARGLPGAAARVAAGLPGAVATSLAQDAAMGDVRSAGDAGRSMAGGAAGGAVGGVIGEGLSGLHGALARRIRRGPSGRALTAAEGGEPSGGYFETQVVRGLAPSGSEKGRKAKLLLEATKGPAGKAIPASAADHAYDEAEPVLRGVLGAEGEHHGTWRPRTDAAIEASVSKGERFGAEELLRAIVPEVEARTISQTGRPVPFTIGPKLGREARRFLRVTITSPETALGAPAAGKANPNAFTGSPLDAREAHIVSPAQARQAAKAGVNFVVEPVEMNAREVKSLVDALGKLKDPATADLSSAARKMLGRFSGVGDVLKAESAALAPLQRDRQLLGLKFKGQRPVETSGPGEMELDPGQVEAVAGRINPPLDAPTERVAQVAQAAARFGLNPEDFYAIRALRGYEHLAGGGTPNLTAGSSGPRLFFGGVGPAVMFRADALGRHAGNNSDAARLALLQLLRGTGASLVPQLRPPGAPETR